jgi:hypothetical protein
MEQYSQFACQSYDSSFLGILPSSFSDLQSPTTQVAVFTKGSQYVVSTMYEEPAKIAVTSLGDMELWIMFAGLILFRDKSKTRTDFTAFAKPTRIFQGEDESQGGEMTNTADIPKRFCFWITISAELFYLIVVGIDLLSEGSDMIQDGYERGKKILWDELRYLFMEAGRGAGR